MISPRSFRLSLRCVLLVFAFAAAACGGGEASSPQSFAAAYCQELAPCCAAASLPTDGKLCRAFVAAQFPEGTFNESQASKCLSELRAAKGKATLCSNPESVAPSCAQPGAHNKKPGETCEDDGDCATSAEGPVECAIDFSAGASTSMCRVLVHGKEGDGPCATTEGANGDSYLSGAKLSARAFSCYVADGLRCADDTQKCTRIPAVGSTCSLGAVACVDGAYCPVAAKKCNARVAVGSECTGNDGSECVDAAYCSEDTNKCTAQAANGATCTLDEMCKSNNCLNGKCQSNGLDDFGLLLICGQP